MSLWYVPGRIAAHLAIFVLAFTIEYAAFGDDNSIVNFVMTPFLVASILPVWRRNISLQARFAGLGIAVIVAMLSGGLYLAIIAVGSAESARFFAVLGGL